MEMKRILFFVLLVFMGVASSAQERLDESRTQELMDQLSQVAASMQTMHCRFVQENNMSILAEPSMSEGVMYYIASDKMRWEYVTPYAFALVVNGDRLLKVEEGKVEAIEGRSGRMYRGMTNLIMDGVTGQKLFDTSTFEVVFYDDEQLWRAEMTPLHSGMKRMFSKLVFRFDKSSGNIHDVDFMDASGNVTSIRFEDIRINEEIEMDKFQ